MNTATLTSSSYSETDSDTVTVATESLGMANLQLVAATVQQLLTQTTALSKQSGNHLVQDDIMIVEALERDTQRAMMHLRRYRNASLPINRLPPELLRMILSHLKQLPVTRSSKQFSTIRLHSYRTLIPAMLVCHRWHAIGSQAASLWTDIDFTRQRAFARLLLSRSLGAPIRLCGYLDKKEELRTVITDHGARIRELGLSIPAKFSRLMPVLQSILATDMPRIRIFSLSCERFDFERGSVVITANPDAPPSFPVLVVMLLKRFLFVPAHALPQLTHLHLAQLDNVDPSNILNLLRNTPALEVFDIMECQEFNPPPNPAPPPRPSSIFLVRLHSMYIESLTTTTVHDLMTRLEAPNLASLRLSSISAKSGAWLETPLIPGSLATRTINRLAFDVGRHFSSFHTIFHGNDLSLNIGISANIPRLETEGRRWAFNDFPTILPLSHVEEFHFQAPRWDTGAEHLLPHLAARMPMVSTLFIRHNEQTPEHLPRDQERPNLMNLARVIVALLESDSPALFPHLAHLELIVSDIPWEFCQLIARALAKCDLHGRRLRKLRIGLDGAPRERWTWQWAYRKEPGFDELGIHHHVDSVSIGEGHCGFSRGDKDKESSNTLGWGEWRDRVQPRQHDYW